MKDKEIKTIGELRSKFFKECTDTGSHDELPKVIVTPHNLFEWFRPYLSSPQKECSLPSDEEMHREIVKQAMDITSKDVIKPKCVRDGIVKPLSQKDLVEENEKLKEEIEFLENVLDRNNINYSFQSPTKNK